MICTRSGKVPTTFLSVFEIAEPLTGTLDVSEDGGGVVSSFQCLEIEREMLNNSSMVSNYDYDRGAGPTQYVTLSPTDIIEQCNLLRVFTFSRLFSPI